MFFAHLLVVMLCASANGVNEIKLYDIPEGCRLNELKEKNEHFCHKPLDTNTQEEMDIYMQDQEKRGIKFDKEPITNAPYTNDNCDGEEKTNCCSSSTIETPTFVLSEGIIKLVLQNSKFRQTIKKTKCKSEGSGPCFEDFSFTAYHTETVCRSDFGTSKLIVYNPKNSTIEHVSVSYPVSCSCHVFIN